MLKMENIPTSVISCDPHVATMSEKSLRDSISEVTGTYPPSPFKKEKEKKKEREYVCACETG